jgi:hypothetical protein
MATKNKGGGAVYVAIDSGSCEIKGENYSFTKGTTLVREGHALLKECPDYFQPASDHVHYDVEQATAAPGEKRGG